MSSKRFALTDFADRMRILRESKGWSQSELARRSGVGQVTLSQWELGKTKSPGLDDVAKVAVSLGVSVDVLAGLRTEDEPSIAAVLAQLEAAQASLAVAHQQLSLFGSLGNKEKGPSQAPGVKLGRERLSSDARGSGRQTERKRAQGGAKD